MKNELQLKNNKSREAIHSLFSQDIDRRICRAQNMNKIHLNQRKQTLNFV